MQSLRRFLNWSLFLASVWAVGWAVFVYVRHTPRCVIEGPSNYMRLSADGSRLVMVEQTGPRFGATARVWDTKRGTIVQEVTAQIDLGSAVFSPDRRHVAAWLGERSWGNFFLGLGSLILIDCDSGEKWRFDDLPWGAIDFSPEGRWLFTTHWRERSRGFVDVHRHQQVRSPKGCFLYFNRDEMPLFRSEETPDELFIWDFREARKIASQAWRIGDLSTSRDGALLVNVGNDWVDGPRGIDVLNSTTLEHIWKVPHGGDVAVSPDNQKLAVWSGFDSKVCEVRFFDLARRQALGIGKMKLTGEMIESCGFSPDGSLWHYFCGADGAAQETVIDVASGNILWEKRWGSILQFAGTTGVVFFQETSEARLQLLDARTGHLRATVPLVDLVGPRPTADAKYFAVSGTWPVNGEPPLWKDWLEKLRSKVLANPLRTGGTAVVMETVTGRELFLVNNCGWNGLVLSDDGSTLLTIDSRHDSESPSIIRIWDVSPTRAYLWAVVAAAGTGIALLSLRLAWRKLTRRSASIQQAPSPSAAA